MLEHLPFHFVIFLAAIMSAIASMSTIWFTIMGKDPAKRIWELASMIINPTSPLPI